MAHFAHIDKNNIVDSVIVAEQEFIDSGAVGGRWIKTSYDTYGGQSPDGQPLRKNYAGIGFTYDSVRDAFIPEKPFDSWMLNEDTCLWEAPVLYPTDGKNYMWNEEQMTWIEMVVI